MNFFNNLNTSSVNRLYQTAFWLVLFTIIYNFIEGALSIYLGLEDESLALFGFGADSFIEVISGLGIAHMIIRIYNHPESSKSTFERTALRITGGAFYALAITLIVSAIFNIAYDQQPIATFFGLIISAVSIIVMWSLVVWKRNIGDQLNSEPILADAQCTMVCIYMSIILLISSGIYALTSTPYIDSLASLGLAFFALKEGRECFKKASSNKYCACD